MPNEVKIIVTAQNKAKGPIQATLSDVNKLRAAVDKIPEKREIKVTVTGGDKAESDIDKVAKKKVDDKETKITAKDDATDTIEKVSNTKPKTVTIPVKADSDKVAGAFGDAGKQGAGAFIGGFTGGLAGGGLIDAASSLITDVFARAGEKQRIQADIGNMMGISPDAAKAYGDRIGAMFWSGIGDSKDQIAGAFGSLSSDVKNWGNLTVDQQDRIVKGAVKVSSAFKVDIQEPIKAASSMVQNGLVPSYEQAFDLITGGYQTLGSRADDTLDTLGEYSGYFQKLGFDGPNALKMINDMMKSGARDTDYAADVWKEFGLKMLAGADDTKKGLKDLGLNSKTILADIAAGGPKAQGAIDKVLDSLRGMSDVRKRDEIGIALFGTQWEDTMKLVIENVDIAKGKVEDFKGATDNLATGAITETEKLGRAWDKFTAEFGEDVATIINHQKDFQDSQNDALGSMFGLGETTEEATAKMYGLGVSLDGTSKGFQALADTVGGYASPKFVEMVGHMSDTQLAAYGVTREMQGVSTAVLTLPDGNKITIDTNTGKVISDLAGVRNAVNSLPEKGFFTYYINTVVTGGGTGSLNSLTGALRGANAHGGAVVGHAAEGGARGGMTLVNEQGPELGRTQRGDLVDLQSGVTVETAGRTAALQAAAGGGRTGGGGGAGGVVQINLNLDRRTLQTVVVDLARDAVSARGGNVQSVLGRG